MNPTGLKMRRNIFTEHVSAGGSARGSALVELPFFIAGVVLIIWIIAKFAFIGMHGAHGIISADAAVKREWIK